MDNIGKFYIDGAWREPHGKKTHTLIDPATEKPICDVPLADAEDVDAAVAAAKAAFPAWSVTSRQARLELLENLLALYMARYEDIAELMTREMGTVRSFSSSAQAWTGQAHLQAAIAALRDFTFEERRGNTLISREPIGVCGLITPWNWPMNQLVVKVAPALAAGCTFVVKPSEFSPLSAVLFSEIVHEAGFPKGVYNYLLGEGAEAGEAMSRHPDIAMISITGSTRAGIAVARDAAFTVKRVHQELGGKSANIVLRDADLGEAVRKGVDACFINCGQACRAPARLLVPMERMDEAAKICRDHVAKIRVGDPSADETDLGPVVNKRQFDRIQDLIQSAIDEGATLVAGGTGRPEGLSAGYYVRPTVFSHVAPKMRIAQEEVFGPVITLIGYESEEQAIEIANDSVYGLAGYIQSADVERARALARKLQVGNVYINDADWDARAPFGGYKQSGNGREHGEFGLMDYLEIKATAAP